MTGRRTPTHRRRRTARARRIALGVIAGVGASIGPAGVLVPAARADVQCPTVLDSHRNPTGSARCHATSSAWTYYQAYVTKNNDCSQTGATLYSTIRVQVLARNVGSGLQVGGFWVVFVNGPRRYGSMEFSALDGNDGAHNSHWNYNAGFSMPNFGFTWLADQYTGAPIRYGLLTSHTIGMPWGRNHTARFEGQFAMSDTTRPYLGTSESCRMIPISVVFQPS